MEKTKLSTLNKTSWERPKHVIWDCESALYDSFELKSFEKQLQSAIVSRTLSMPHLSARSAPPPLPSSNNNNKKKSDTSKIARSFKRLMRAVFWTKSYNNTCIKYNTAVSPGKLKKERSELEEGYYFVYEDKTTLSSSPALSTIPEASVFDDGLMLSPDLKSLARRTASERFSGASTKF